MKLKVLAVCGNGQGSSMIMKMKIAQFLKNQKIDSEVQSCAVSEAKSVMRDFDIIVASTHIAGEIRVPEGKYVVGVKNMLSDKDFGPKIIEVVDAHFSSARL